MLLDLSGPVYAALLWAYLNMRTNERYCTTVFNKYYLFYIQRTRLAPGRAR